MTATMKSVFLITVSVVRWVSRSFQSTAQSRRIDGRISMLQLSAGVFYHTGAHIA